MKRPVIGLVPLVDIQWESYWMLPGYMDGVEEAGGMPPPWRSSPSTSASWT